MTRNRSSRYRSASVLILVDSKYMPFLSHTLQAVEASCPVKATASTWQHGVARSMAGC